MKTWKKVKQRDLQRHLRVKVSDLDEIKGILASYYMIFTSDRGGYNNLTVVYYYKHPGFNKGSLE